MIRVKYPLNLVKTGYEVLRNGGADEETIRSIKLSRKKYVEKKLNQYIVSEPQIKKLQADIDRIREDMTSIGSPVISDMPKAPFNPTAATDRLTQRIDDITKLERHIARIEGDRDKTKAALQNLDAVDLSLIRMLYGLDRTPFMTQEEASAKLGYSRRQLCRMRDSAIEILAYYLVGDVVLDVAAISAT